jgi:hypothetical protein
LGERRRGAGSVVRLFIVGGWAGGWRGLIIGMLLAPAVSTAAYNLVKRTDEGNENPDELFVTFSASF